MDTGVWMEVREDIEEILDMVRSCFDTKIKKKEKNTYLCHDKIPLVMILGCIYIHILITCLSLI